MFRKILLILIVLVPVISYSIGHTQESDSPPTLPPFSITVDIVRDGDLVGVGKCDIRMGVDDWKDRVEIIGFFEEPEADCVTVSLIWLEIINQEKVRPGVYNLMCKDFAENIYNGFIDYSEVREDDSDTRGNYKIELRNIEGGELITNISDKGRLFVNKYIPKVDL